jgi:surfeit locus 1 family protein
VLGISFADRAVRSAAIATGVSLVILLSLGAWQIQRLHWKQGILADIDRAEFAPPVPLGANPKPFTKVVAHGLLLPGTALYGDDVRDIDGKSAMGAQRLQILLRGRQPPLLVDLGWVPDGAHRPPPAIGPTQVLGYIREADHAGALSAQDDVKHRHFYTLDPALIAPSLGIHAKPAPYTLVAMGALAAAGAPLAAIDLPRPPNNHLQYAFTWFGLAAALVGVFIAWARGRGRPPEDTIVPLMLGHSVDKSPDSVT